MDPEVAPADDDMFNAIVASLIDYTGADGNEAAKNAA